MPYHTICHATDRDDGMGLRPHHPELEQQLEHAPVLRLARELRLERVGARERRVEQVERVPATQNSVT